LTAITLAIAGLFGVSLALLMPPFQFNDEHGHFARAYQISRGEVVAHPDHAQLPAAVLSILLRYPEGITDKSIPRTSVADLFAGGAGEFSPAEPIGNIHELRYLSWGYLAYQIYWPVCYLPASAGIRMTRLFNLSPLSMLYAARLMNLLSFLVALTIALRLAPGFRALITGLALMPMTLQQAVAVSADSITIAFALVGFALLLRTREQPVTHRYLAIVLATVPMWAMCKNSIWALPLLLLIPGWQFNGRRQRTAFVLTATVVTVAALVLWRIITNDAFGQLVVAGLSRGINFESNARQFMIHPLRILHDVISFPDTLTYCARLIRRFVGAFGWNYVNLPVPLAPTYLLMLVVAACAELNPKPFTATERAILGLVFAGALIQTYLMLFVIDGSYANGRYGFWSAGVQGRYLIPYCLAGFLALRQNAIPAISRALAPMVLAVSAFCGLLSLNAILRFYYH
jgi:uncharacterized membrane protein